MSVFRRLRGRGQTTALPEWQHPKPGHPIQVVGDIHGRIDLLEQMLRYLDARVPTIFVGDYIDRGEHSNAVLSRLRELSSSHPDIYCLMGNHEDMMLGFLRDPVENGNRWLRNGGLQTLASFGINGLATQLPDQKLIDCRDRLIAAMEPGLLDWLSALPANIDFGNVFVVHAGVAPDVPIHLQTRKTMLWGHPSFLSEERTDDVWVVHGHTIVDQPSMSRGRIAVDTGAYATGRLTAALISDQTVRFFGTGDEPLRK